MQGGPSDRLLIVLDISTCRQQDRDPIALARDVVGAGARRLWYRNYADKPPRQVEEITRIRQAVADAGARLVVGGAAAEALACHAEGAHLPSGVSPQGFRHRTRVGLLGQSCHAIDEVRRAERAEADYVTLSPIWPPSSPKSQPRPPIGLAGLTDVASRTGIPIYALGGIDARNAAQCIAAGAFGVAVLGAVCAAVSPARAVDDLLVAIAQGLANRWAEAR